MMNFSTFLSFGIFIITLVASKKQRATARIAANDLPLIDSVEDIECIKTAASPFFTGDLTTPTQQQHQQQQQQQFSSSNSDVSKFVAALTGIWTSARCEISPGPEFTYRRYVFYTSPQDDNNPLPPNPSAELSPRVFFRSIHFKFTDPNCKSPIFAFSAEGELTVAQSLSRQFFSATPGSEEAEVSVYRVSITIFNATAFLASNYSVFSIRQQSANSKTPPPPTTTAATEDEEEDEETRRDRKDVRFSPTCNLERLWPHLAEQLPKIAGGHPGNTLIFEMYNELEPTAEWYQWSPLPINNSRRQRILDENERSKNEDRLDCLKKAGFNIDELLLLRIERRRVYYEQNNSGGNWSEISVLKTGQIFRGIFGELNYKPAMYASNLLFQYKQPFPAAVCQLCTALAQGDIEDNCYSKFFATTLNLSPSNYLQPIVADATFLLPNMWPQSVASVKGYESLLEKESERWISTRCETRPYGVFLMRQIVFSQRSSALFRGIYLYYEDPFCTTPTYDLEIGGDYRIVRGVYNPYPAKGGVNDQQQMFGAAFLFNTNWAKLRPRNAQAVTTLSEYSLAGSCGQASQWRLGEWQDVSPTNGCLAIGIRIPTEELQLVRLETASDGFNKATFLYVGDAQSKRPLSPSLMASTNGANNGYHEPTSAEVRNGVDFVLFEQIRPTSFLEPMIKCRDLVTIYKSNNRTPIASTSNYYSQQVQYVQLGDDDGHDLITASTATTAEDEDDSIEKTQPPPTTTSTMSMTTSAPRRQQRGRTKNSSPATLTCSLLQSFKTVSTCILLAFCSIIIIIR